jgi:hypothetical protein
VAAAFHPRFHLLWLQKHKADQIIAVEEAMELQVGACMKKKDEAVTATSIEENSEDD